MIGALALGFDGVEAGFVRVGRVRKDQICGVGDIVWEMVWRSGDSALSDRASARPSTGPGEAAAG
jgi:hypothetical protein